jgi:hypothetical protein
LPPRLEDLQDLLDALGHDLVAIAARIAAAAPSAAARLGGEARRAGRRLGRPAADRDADVQFLDLYRHVVLPAVNAYWMVK